MLAHPLWIGAFLAVAVAAVEIKHLPVAEVPKLVSLAEKAAKQFADSVQQGQKNKLAEAGNQEEQLSNAMAKLDRCFEATFKRRLLDYCDFERCEQLRWQPTNVAGVRYCLDRWQAVHKACASEMRESMANRTYLDDGHRSVGFGTILAGDRLDLKYKNDYIEDVGTEFDQYKPIIDAVESVESAFESLEYAQAQVTLSNGLALANKIDAQLRKPQPICDRELLDELDTWLYRFSSAKRALEKRNDGGPLGCVMGLVKCVVFGEHSADHWMREISKKMEQICVEQRKN